MFAAGGPIAWQSMLQTNVYLEHAGGVPGNLYGVARNGVASGGDGRTKTAIQQTHSILSG